MNRQVGYLSRALPTIVAIPLKPTCLNEFNNESTLIVYVSPQFSDPKRVPRNARKAITLEFFKYFPAGPNKNYSSYYIDRTNGRNLLSAADTGQREIHDLSIQIEDMKTDIERKKGEIDDYTEKIAQLGRKEELAKEEVAAQRSGFQEVNVEISRCMAAQGDLSQGDKSEELQQHVEEKEAALDKKKIEMEQLKEKMREIRIAVESTKRELNARKGELATDTPRNDSQQKLKMKEEELKRKRNQLRNLENAKVIQAREILETKRLREEKLRAAEDLKKEANERMNGEDIGEVTESLAELKLRQLKLNQQRKEYSSGLNREEFQTKFMKLVDENARLNKDFKACSNHVARMSKGIRARGVTFDWTRKSSSRVIMRNFNMRMSDYRLFGKLIFDHDYEKLSFEIAHMDEHNEKIGKGMPLSNFSGGERSRTLACFILSLWEMNISPFRALDELDVYLDEVNRSQVEEQLIDFARRNKQYQFIFISPQAPSDDREINVIEIKKQ